MRPRLLRRRRVRQAVAGLGMACLASTLASLVLFASMPQADWTQTFGTVLPDSDRLLANGVLLPATWPPRLRQLSQRPRGNISGDALPHAVTPLPLAAGRQLLLDDWLLANTLGDVARVWHTAQPDSGFDFPVPTSRATDQADTATPGPQQRALLTMQAPNPGGVWCSDGKVLHVWYQCGALTAQGDAPLATCYANATADGTGWWHAPAPLQLAPHPPLQASWSVASVVAVADADAALVGSAVPAARFLMLLESVTSPTSLRMSELLASSDGVIWEHLRDTWLCVDRCSLGQDRLRHRWIWQLRVNRMQPGQGRERVRLYYETADLLEARAYADQYLQHSRDTEILPPSGPVYWLRAAADESVTPGACPSSVKQRSAGVYSTQLLGYESLQLVLLDIYHCGDAVTKSTQVFVGASRDGFHITRHAAPLLAASASQRYLMSIPGGIIVHQDTLHLYYSAVRTDDHGVALDRRMLRAVLRRDGFASMSSTRAGQLETRRFVIRHGDPCHAYVNVNATRGVLTVSLLDAATSRPLAHAAVPRGSDSTSYPLVWTSLDPATCRRRLRPDRSMRLRFVFVGAVDLYSFWFAHDSLRGSSGGLGAAGGPGLAHPARYLD